MSALFALHWLASIARLWRRQRRSHCTATPKLRNVEEVANQRQGAGCGGRELLEGELNRARSFRDRSILPFGGIDIGKPLNVALVLIKGYAEKSIPPAFNTE